MRSLIQGKTVPVVVGVVLLLAVAWWLRSAPAPEVPSQAAWESPPEVRLPPASRMTIRLGTATGAANPQLDPGAKFWESAIRTRVLLNRSPRIYQTEKPSANPPPKLEVCSGQTESGILVRLDWNDATRNAPEAPKKQAGEAGVPGQLYKRPTGSTSAFADAAAVMVPTVWPTSDGQFPSLVMGDARQPVRVYFWNASRGAEQLSAEGRAKVEATGKAVRAQARHTNGRWTVILELPRLPEKCPVAFAIWDGETGDRDGIKFFSLWYVLE